MHYSHTNVPPWKEKRACEGVATGADDFVVPEAEAFNEGGMLEVLEEVEGLDMDDVR